ncbi:MAG: YjbE family putative metal transport protein [Alphaproteobacteria bacterium]
MTPEFLDSELFAMIQVICIDLVLAGDNAIVVGMAAAGVAPEHRRKVICGGIALAVVLRIIFAALTMQLLGVIGLTLAGGLLLLWVAWKLYRELLEQREEDIGASLLDGTDEAAPNVVGQDVRSTKTMRAAMIQVAIADISMSLDNVLAVAGAADDHMSALIVGLTLSVILMGIGASLIAGLLQKHHWIGYLGLVLIAYVAFSMIWRGGMEVWAIASI